MGRASRAKRQRRLDTNKGKHNCQTQEKDTNSKIYITRSNITSNWLIMIDDYCYDSAISIEDATMVAGELEKACEKYPFPKERGRRRIWLEKVKGMTTQVNSQAFILSPDGPRGIIVRD